MKLAKKFRIGLEDFYSNVWINHAVKYQFKVYKINGNGVNVKHCLTDDEKRAIDEFFLENYGKKIPYDFHEVYKSFSGRFDEKCFPEFLFMPKLDNFLNPKEYASAINDKNLFPILAERAGVKTPEIVVYNSNGTYFNPDHEIISREEAVSRVVGQTELFFKPTIDSCGGHGCKAVDAKGGYDTIDEKLVNELFDEYKSNFVVQKLLHNHASIKAVAPDSLNTFRIMTYHIDGEIHNTNAIMRFGTGGSRVDNASSGGYLIGVMPDGTLLKEAMTDACRTDKITAHPDSGLTFEGHKIEGFEKVVESAKKMHAYLPLLGIIDWDFTIDENGDPVLVEINVRNGGGVQMIQWCHGTALFGDDTAKVLQFLQKAEKMKDSERKAQHIHM